MTTTNYTAEQNMLIAEISSTYGTDPEDITFFSGDPTPFFGFETQCAILNRHNKPKVFTVDPVESISPDSLSHCCTLVFPDGSNYSYVGVVNRQEVGRDNKPLGDQQLAYLASSRALRSTLRIAAIDLLKLHWASKNDPQELDFTGVRSARASLNAEAHALGHEIGLIVGEDKTFWYRLLDKRFKVGKTNLLSDAELADWVAYLKTLAYPASIQAASA